MGQGPCPQTRISPLTVPAAPSMVPIHLKRLSDSGKAEMPLSPDICGGSASGRAETLPTPVQPGLPLGPPTPGLVPGSTNPDSAPGPHSPSAPSIPAAACGESARYRPAHRGSPTFAPVPAPLTSSPPRRGPPWLRSRWLCGRLRWTRRRGRRSARPWLPGHGPAHRPPPPLPAGHGLDAAPGPGRRRTGLCWLLPSLPRSRSGQASGPVRLCRCRAAVRAPLVGLPGAERRCVGLSRAPALRSQSPFQMLSGSGAARSRPLILYTNSSVSVPLRCRSGPVQPRSRTLRSARPAWARAPFECFRVRPSANQRTAPFEPANHRPPRMQLPR